MEDMYLDVASTPVIKRLSKLFKVTSIATIALILGVSVISFKVIDYASSHALIPDRIIDNEIVLGLSGIFLVILHLAIVALICVPVWKAYKVHKQLDMLVETGDADMLPLIFKNLTHILFFFLAFIVAFLAIVAIFFLIYLI